MMVRWLPWIAALAGAFAPLGFAEAGDRVTSLRLAVATPEAEGTKETSCMTASDVGGHRSKDYISHLQSRFQNPIVLCLTKDHYASAALLAAGEVDFAWVSAEAFGPIKSKSCPIKIGRASCRERV